MADLKRYEIERQEEWSDACKKMPKLRFPAYWDVTILPPFGGAMARFMVDLPCGQHKSIFADFHHTLGYFGMPGDQPIPYWEVYPYRGDVGRCEIGDVQKLFEMIADTNEGEQ